jgi:hypothetical protein
VPTGDANVNEFLTRCNIGQAHHKDMPKLVAALRARDQQLGIAVSVQSVA